MLKRVMKDALGEVALENWDDKIQWEDYNDHQILKDQTYERGKFLVYGAPKIRTSPNRIQIQIFGSL